MSDNSEPQTLEQQVRRHWDEAQAAWQRGCHAEALASLAACRDLLEPTGLLHSQYTVWFEIGRMNEERGGLQHASAAYAEAVKKAETAADPALAARAYHRLGQVERVAGNALTARGHFERSAQLCEAQNDARGVALSLAMIGQITFTEGRREEGLRQMLQALAMIPPEAAERAHLLSHVAFFGLRVEEDLFHRLANEEVVDPNLRTRLSAERAARLADNRRAND